MHQNLISREVQNEYVERRNIMVEGLNKIPGVFCPKPKGAFYCVARFPVKNAENFCQWLLEEYAHEGQTVMMAPAAGSIQVKTWNTGSKNCLCFEKESLLKSIEVLSEALKVYPDRLS